MTDRAWIWDFGIRLAIFALAAGAMAFPFLHMRMFGSDGPVAVDLLVMVVYALFPLLAFLALVSTLWGPLRPHGVLFSRLTSLVGLVYVVILGVMVGMLSIFSIVGTMLGAPFYWGAVALKEAASGQASTDAPPITTPLEDLVGAMPGIGGWMLIAAFTLSITRGWRANRDRPPAGPV